MINLKGKSKKFTNFNSIKLGSSSYLSCTITNKIHNQFKNLSGDDSKIHTSLKFCKRNNHDKKMGYGFLITSILSNIYGTKFPGGLELCLSQDCKFIKPYYVGDKLTFKNKIIYKNPNLKLITISNIVYKNNKTKIFEGKAVLQIAFISN